MIDTILIALYVALGLTLAWCCYWADRCREPDEVEEITIPRADASSWVGAEFYSMRAWQPGHFTGEVIDDG